jgi:hypothetical protein
MKENLRRPSIIKQVLAGTGLREITPGDISPNRETLDRLYENHPDLTGGRTAIGYGDEGKCQSWRGNPGWWKDFIKR